MGKGKGEESEQKGVKSTLFPFLLSAPTLYWLKLPRTDLANNAQTSIYEPTTWNKLPISVVTLSMQYPYLETPIYRPLSEPFFTASLLAIWSIQLIHFLYTQIINF